MYLIRCFDSEIVSRQAPPAMKSMACPWRDPPPGKIKTLPVAASAVYPKTEISCALWPDQSQTELPGAANQLILFDF